jgi:REP element-mobilizing transposase RayT
MTYNSEIHHRRSIRLKEYDYSQAGAYFVKVCAWNRECLFGEISQGKVNCNEAGKVVADVWNKLPERFPSIELDEFVIMPNHIHGIVILNTTVGAGLALPGTKHKQTGAASGAPTLGDIMRTFKSMSVVTANRRFDRPGCPVWQRNYYEHIIRDEKELHAIREYIRYNPLKWDEDEENPHI